MRATDNNSGLTADYVRERLSYDPITGVFTRMTAWGRFSIGDIAGCKRKDGYREIKLDGRGYLAHRLAWLVVYGTWPAENIDHLNGIRDDNRIANLRDVTKYVNQQNTRCSYKGNVSGFLGVHWVKNIGKFTACIKSNKQQIHLGCFTDPAEAHQAYLKAKRQLHAGCTI